MKPPFYDGLLLDKHRNHLFLNIYLKIERLSEPCGAQQIAAQAAPAAAES